MPDKSEKTETRFNYHTHIMHESQQVISRSRRLLEETNGLVRPPYRASTGSTLRGNRREEPDEERTEDPK